jgi:predicted oxidoreductase
MDAQCFNHWNSKDVQYARVISAYLMLQEGLACLSIWRRSWMLAIGLRYYIIIGWGEVCIVLIGI